MCYYSIQSKDALSLAKRFKAKINTSEPIQSNEFIGFTFPKTPIITNKLPEQIQAYQWGLIPNWAKDKSIQAYTLNAKIETLTEKPSFKNNIENRCLVIVDGFKEWQWLDSKGKKKQPFKITLPNEELFAFAGLYSTWTDKTTGDIINTYTIVTTVANELMSTIHNSKKRMPVILTPQNEQLWLQGHSLSAFENCNIDLEASPIL